MSSRFAVEKLDHGPLLTNHSHLYNRNTNVLRVHECKSSYVWKGKKAFVTLAQMMSEKGCLLAYISKVLGMGKCGECWDLLAIQLVFLANLIYVF